MGNFDMVICGTSVKECFLSGILASLDGKKILHIDRNSFYGGESASFNLSTLTKFFRGDEAKVAEALAGDRNSDYCIDIAPKFLMGSGVLVECLAKLIPSDYLQYAKVGGSFVFHYTTSGIFTKTTVGGLHQIPTTTTAALGSSLISNMQKLHFPNFMKFIMKYDPADAKTHGSYDMKTLTMAQFYQSYSIDQVGRTFVSHALALEGTEDHLNQLAETTIMKIKLYALSLARFNDSPYLYPKYGLGGIAEAFTRLSSIFGCTFITSCNDFKMNTDNDGAFSGVSFTHAIDDQKYVATAPAILADPSYFASNASRPVGQICRAVVVLSRPITGAADNCQIIVPGCEVKRVSDIYISALSSTHSVCPNGRYFAVVSTMNNGEPVDLTDKAAVTAACQRELKIAHEILTKPDAKLGANQVLEQFDWIIEQRVPVPENLPGGAFMTESLDCTTHFQTVMEEIKVLYQAITGNPFDPKTLRRTEDVQKEAREKQEKLEQEAAAAEAAAAAATTE
jgi:Rab GDP dissociation inhibitor